MTLKGPLCSSGELFQTQNFGVYNVNGEIKQTHKYTDKQAFLSGKKKTCPQNTVCSYKGVRVHQI